MASTSDRPVSASANGRRALSTVTSIEHLAIEHPILCSITLQRVEEEFDSEVARSQQRSGEHWKQHPPCERCESSRHFSDHDHRSPFVIGQLFHLIRNRQHPRCRFSTSHSEFSVREEDYSSTESAEDQKEMPSSLLQIKYDSRTNSVSHCVV